MTKEATRKRKEPGIVHRDHKTGLAMMESYLPAGSTQRTAAEIAAGMGGALLVAAMIGVGPAALAGGAGYLVYRETHRKAA